MNYRSVFQKLLQDATVAEKEARDSQRECLEASAKAGRAASRLSNLRAQLKAAIEQEENEELESAEDTSNFETVIEAEFEDDTEPPPPQEKRPIHEVRVTGRVAPKDDDFEPLNIQDLPQPPRTNSVPHSSMKGHCPSCRRKWPLPNPWQGRMPTTFQCLCGYKVMANYDIMGR